MTENEVLEIQKQVVDVCKLVYDPEIPVNIYDLGLLREVSSCDVELVFEPEWNQDMITEEAKLELGML